MSDIAAAPEDAVRTTVSIDFPTEVRVRDFEAREIDVRLVPWNVVINTSAGLEMFARGAFADADPTQVRLMGLEHEVHMGLGQNGQPKLTRHPVGIATHLDDRDDGEHATFRVARTVRGDEVLALAAEGIASGVSVEFNEVPGGSPIEVVEGRKVRVHRRARLQGASTTYRPAYGLEAGGSVVLAVRNEGENPVSETPVAEAPPEAPAPVFTADFGPLTAAIEAQTTAMRASLDQLDSRIVEMEEQGRRSAVIVPGTQARAYPDDFQRGDWMSTVLRIFSGERLPNHEIQAREVADLITTDNLGVIPKAYLNEIIGIIDRTRPFLDSTRRLNIPRSGTQLSVPKIVTRPTTGIQAAEKDELTSTTTSITETTFGMTTIGGYGDISLQLLRRSDPSYLELYQDLLAEAYGIDADDKAIDVLLDSGVSAGGSLDPEDLEIGQAWANAAAVSRLLVADTIWMSTAAVSAFIDAKSPLTNAPLYSNLQANFTVGGGTGGSVSGLRPVHVPALDNETADVVIGPSRGFGWAEDGTYTLQVDVPAKAGRDVAIVGMVWFAPMYPAAFTTYQLAGS